MTDRRIPSPDDPPIGKLADRTPHAFGSLPGWSYGQPPPTGAEWAHLDRATVQRRAAEREPVLCSYCAMESCTADLPCSDRAASHARDTPTVTRRAADAMRITPADPRLLRIVTALEESIVLAIGKGRGPIDTATLRDIRSGLANGVSAMSAEIAGEVEELRAMLGAAVDLVTDLTTWYGLTLTLAEEDAAQLEMWRKAVRQ